MHMLYHFHYQYPISLDFLLLKNIDLTEDEFLPVVLDEPVMHHIKLTLKFNIMNLHRRNKLKN